MNLQVAHIKKFNGVIMGDVDNLGNLSTGDYNHNTSTNNILESKLDILLEKIKSLELSDKSEIIKEIESNRNNKEQLTNILGQLMTRGSEISTIAPYIGELLGLIG